MLRDTLCLKGVVSEAKSKDGANTILQKQFPGGSLSLVCANSPRGFRRVSRRVVLFDEVDGYPPSAGTEATRSSWALGVLSITGTGRSWRGQRQPLKTSAV